MTAIDIWPPYTKEEFDLYDAPEYRECEEPDDETKEESDEQRDQREHDEYMADVRAEYRRAQGF